MHDPAVVLSVKRRKCSPTSRVANLSNANKAALNSRQFIMEVGFLRQPLPTCLHLAAGRAPSDERLASDVTVMSGTQLGQNRLCCTASELFFLLVVVVIVVVVDDDDEISWLLMSGTDRPTQTVQNRSNLFACTLC